LKYILNSLLFLFLLNSVSIFSQPDNSKKKKHKIIYTNTNDFEFYFNRESNFSNGKVFQYKGFGIEINSFHGVFVTRNLSISIGLGITFNINESFKALPIVAQLKYHFYNYNKEGPFILLNTGTNINVGSFTKGQSSKLGFGYVLESDKAYSFVVGAFAKSKTYLLNKQTNFNYQTESFGLSVGIQF